MKSSSKVKALASWVTDFFQTGIALTPEHQHYLQTTFGDSDLTRVLEDSEGCEIESFLQLIFYPNQILRLRYEQDWGETVWTAEDVSAVMACLNKSPMKGRIQQGAGRPALWVALTAGFLQPWLDRLRITWQLEPEIADVLSGITDSSHRALIRIQLRHAPLQWYGGQTVLVALFLSRVPDSSEDVGVCLSDLLDLLAAMRSDQPVEAFLAERKMFFFQSLCKAEEFESRRRQQAMEVLMMQGCRAVFGSADHWRWQIARVDGLSRILFGEIPDIVPLDCREQVLTQKAIYKPFQLP